MTLHAVAASSDSDQRARAVERSAPRFAAAWLFLLAATLLPLAVPPLAAQDELRATPLPQWELRADWIEARAAAAHLGLGVNVRTGWYARVGAALAAGAAEGPGGEWQSSRRVDLAVRFLLDPFAERRVGVYGGAGVSARWDGTAPGDARLLVVLGVEGRPVGGVLPSVEVGLGGGFRVGTVLRRRRPGPAR